jgi:P-type E1-E2 ATPase
MIEIEVPRRGHLQLTHLVCDVNGTLSLDGRLLPGVPERIARLRQLLDVHLITADSFGRQALIDADLGLVAERLVPSDPEDEQKAAYVRGLGAANVVAIGNGANDALMFSEAALSICVLGREGTAVIALSQADLLAPDIETALDLLLYPQRIRATLRR